MSKPRYYLSQDYLDDLIAEHPHIAAQLTHDVLEERKQAANAQAAGFEWANPNVINFVSILSGDSHNAYGCWQAGETISPIYHWSQTWPWPKVRS